ncbi:MAG: hypothetical protein JOZ78_26450 [Chroococcidiopsidaceae cyanobacterium CP_BM_ER_R8_30]|nr:hypothetical protein [Chroococcidiopsidaceae cyanobacterium CP_BM_ER_R8_30]
MGWLLDPQHSRVEIYRQGQDVEVLQSPSTKSPAKAYRSVTRQFVTLP